MAENNAIVRARARLEQALLSIEEIEIDGWRVWRISNLKQRQLLYWPRQDTWRSEDGKLRGRGTLTLIAEMKGHG
jgi:hypothetical protein